LKTADTRSMGTQCRMTKFEDPTPINRWGATGHNHQLSETARENTSNQAYLTNGTKEQSSNWNASYKIITPINLHRYPQSGNLVVRHT